MWVFLPVLRVFLNLAHYVRAELLGDGTLTLYRDSSARDQLKVTDPTDINALREVFEGHGFNTLVVGELAETEQQPAPAEAATDVEASVPQSTDPPANVDAPPSNTSEAATPPATPQGEPSQPVTETEVAPPKDAEANVSSPAADEPAAEDKPADDQPAADQPAGDADVAADQEQPATEDKPVEETPAAPSSPFLRR
jgi:hypothetical protein